MGWLNRRDWLRLTATGFLAPLAAPLLAQQSQRPDPYADAKLLKGEPPLPAKDAFTIAVLPDTQNYSEKFPDQYFAQTRWLVEQQARRNIAAVLHLGDITNRNTPAEWEVARTAMRQLDGKIPWFICPGNHDYSDGGVCKDRTTLLNEYFPVGTFKNLPTFGGTYDREPDRMENNFNLFEAGGRKFLVLALEFGPRADVVRWANEVAARYRDREAILITHAFVYSDDTRYDWKKYGRKQNWNPHSYQVARATNDDVADGQELWDGLLSKHENFILALNGHVLNSGLGQTDGTTTGGRVVPQVLVNFQMKPKGGDGWLRLLEFRPDHSVEVFDYSPTRDERNEGTKNRFALRLPPLARG